MKEADDSPFCSAAPHFSPAGLAAASSKTSFQGVSLTLARLFDDSNSRE